MDIKINEFKIVIYLENNVGYNYFFFVFIDYSYIDRKKNKEFRVVLN